jgi:hypothetical protein
MLNMNRFFVLAVSCLVFAGCKKAPEAAPAEAAAAPKAVRIDEAAPEAPPPPAAPGTQAEGTDGQPPPPPPDEKPEKITPLTEREVAMLNYAVYKYREEVGRLPKSLQEMVGKTLPRMPQIHPSEKLNYDPSTGLIKVEKVK